MSYRLDITRRLHERLMEIVGAALPLIGRSMRDADLAGLAHLREEMVEAMELYCRHVHRLRDTALHAQDVRAAADAEVLVAGCTGLRAAYDSFRKRWAHRHAIEHWPEYRLSAIVMMKQVRACVRTAEDLRIAHLSLAA